MTPKLIESQERIRVIILEDDETERNLLAIYLTSHNMEVASAKTVAEFRRLIHQHPSFEVALIDLSLPDEFGMNVIMPLRQSSDTGIIVLSSHSEQDTKIEALHLGADDYVTKPFHLGELLARIQTLRRRIEATPTYQHRKALESLLSEREMLVLNHIAQGCTGKEIAKTLAVSPRTVDTYRNRIIGKLKAKSIAELTQIAVHAGLV